jgi:hypothetical protein
MSFGPMDYNLWISGTPPVHPGDVDVVSPVPVPVNAELNADVAPLGVRAGGDGSTVQASVALGGTTQAVRAGVAIGGGTQSLRASLSASLIKPLQASVAAALSGLPDLVVRIKEVPKFEIDAPSHLRVGFRVLGIELCAVSLRGRSRLRSE